MKQLYISKIKINNVRHLKKLEIPLSSQIPKHLILTGKNGSGKTSVLQALSYYLNVIVTGDLEKKEIVEQLEQQKSIIEIELNESIDILRSNFEKGNFVLAYYKAERIFEADIPKHIEKIILKTNYHMNEEPRSVFVKYLLDLKVTEALARNNGKVQKADEINVWFKKFENLLGKIFEDDSLELVFDEDSYAFFIKTRGRELFDFNSLSSGFAAILDIVLDIIVRMEKATDGSFKFNIPGIVLIDEIETHLHVELQKSILELLTTIFPNIQFILSTHSPFILNSLENVIIYDLENHTIVENGLANVPYSGIIEGYFLVDEMSASLKRKYERYKELVKKKKLTDDDFEEIAELELYLNEIPDYLALDITTEYQRIKMEFERREDV